jgi:hypothetical protein
MKIYKINYSGNNYKLKKYDYKNIKENQKLFYCKNDIIELIKIIKIYPGNPAQPESYTIKIIESKNSDRINREINVPHKSDKLYQII